MAKLKDGSVFSEVSPPSVCDLLKKLTSKAVAISRKQLRDQVVRVLERYVPEIIVARYERLHPSLQDLPVTLVVLGDLAVRFNLNFKFKQGRRRQRDDFGQASLTLGWLEDQVEQLERLAADYTNEVINRDMMPNEKQSQELERITAAIGKGQKSFESGLYQVRKLVENIADSQDSEEDEQDLDVSECKPTNLSPEVEEEMRLRLKNMMQLLFGQPRS